MGRNVHPSGLRPVGGEASRQPTVAATKASPKPIRAAPNSSTCRRGRSAGAAALSTRAGILQQLRGDERGVDRRHRVDPQPQPASIDNARRAASRARCRRGRRGAWPPSHRQATPETPRRARTAARRAAPRRAALRARASRARTPPAAAPRPAPARSRRRRSRAQPRCRRRRPRSRPPAQAPTKGSPASTRTAAGTAAAPRAPPERG